MQALVELIHEYCSESCLGRTWNKYIGTSQGGFLNASVFACGRSVAVAESEALNVFFKEHLDGNPTMGYSRAVCRINLC